MNSDIDILKTFLQMPLFSSKQVIQKFQSIKGSEHRGEGLKQFLYIRGSRKNKVLLVAHADTVWDSLYDLPTPKNQNVIIEDGKIRNTNGGLGADDRAGCAILWLLKEFGHSLLITNGEEGGGIGSGWLMDHNKDIADEINDNHQFAIQFDRRNGTDFKCYEVGTDEFRAYIEKKTGYTEPDRSSFTDIVTLCKNITGVNLSVGYHNEHTENEFIIAEEWQNTLDICRKWLSEDNLPKYDLP